MQLEGERERLSSCFVTCWRTRCTVLPQVHGLGREVENGWTSLHEHVVSLPNMEASFISLHLPRAFIKASVGKTATMDQKYPQCWCCFLFIGSCSASHVSLFQLRQGQRWLHVSFSLVVSLSFPSCFDKEVDSEAHTWLLYRWPTRTGVSVDLHGTEGVVGSKGYTWLLAPAS